MNIHLHPAMPTRVVSTISRAVLIVAVSTLSLARAEDMMKGGMGDDPPMNAMPADGAKPPMEPMEDGAMPPDAAKAPMAPMKHKPAMGMGMGMKGKKDKAAMGMGMGMGMGMMGKGMPGAGAATTSTMPSSALPAFAGAAGLYHVGATGFFLDRAELTSLTQPQRTALTAIKMESEKEQASYSVQIEAGERALWLLTGAEQPDAMAVDAKIREIEALRSQQRFGFIQAVGKAGSILSPAQRSQLASAMPQTGATVP